MWICKRRALWAMMFGVLIVSGGQVVAQQPTAVRFSPRTTIRLADAEQGRALIERRDDYTAALSTFDLQSRLKTDGEVKVEDLLALYRENVTDWPEEDAIAVSKAVERVRDQLKGLVLPLPETVWIVRTTGKEESGAAYCRGPAVVLPANQLRQDEAGLTRLVAHELFHILSSHNAQLKHDLYALIGFTVCEPIAPPKSLQARTIANPDAPRIDCVMALDLADGEKVHAAPVLLSSAERFDPAAGKSMFDYLQFRLLAVEKHDDAWRAVEQEGMPRLIDPKKVDTFWKQIGRNTGYIIHPDEILADNFAHLVMQSEKLPSPEIVEKMQARLAKESAAPR